MDLEAYYAKLRLACEAMADVYAEIDTTDAMKIESYLRDILESNDRNKLGHLKDAHIDWMLQHPHLTGIRLGEGL